MDYTKIQEFFRQHWPAAIIVLIVVSPAIWVIASTHFSERITVLEKKVEILKEEVDVLKEYKKRTEKKQQNRNMITSSSIEFETDELVELYTPSDSARK